MRNAAAAALLTFCLSAAAAAQAHAHDPNHRQDPHAGHGHAPAAARPKSEAPKSEASKGGASKSEQPTAAAAWFTEVELVDQDGRKVRFYSDVLKGKTVVVNAFFTTCTSVCPPMNRNMEKIQEAFGDRLGRDLFLVSITVDPATDTPPRLKDYASRFHAGPGWTFLTGEKENVERALYKLGQYVEDKENHKTVFIIGNETTGLWKKAMGMASAGELVEIVRSVVDDRGPAAKEE
jgi:protein SCO1